MVSYLGLEVVHAGFDNGDETLELLAHGVTENILLLLHLEALHAHLGLVGHAADELIGESSTLPLSGLLAQVLCQHRQETPDLGLGTEVLEKRVKGVLGRLLDGGSLVCQQVEGERD